LFGKFIDQIFNVVQHLRLMPPGNLLMLKNHWSN